MKILIFGPPWSGKTAIARRISESLKIPLFELDSVFYRALGQDTVGERTEIIKSILEKEGAWCMEWMYRQDWLDRVIEGADHVFLVECPLVVLHYRIILRTLRRMIGLEKYERESSWKLLFGFLCFNQCTYREVHKRDFLDRMKRLGKECKAISSFDDVMRNLKEDSETSSKNYLHTSNS